MIHKPYIGITGFSTPQEVNQVSKLYLKEGLPKDHTAMYGIITSNKRIANPDTRGKSSPSIGNIPSIVSAIPQWALPMLHYYNPENKGFSQELYQLMDVSNCNAVQLNMKWPNIEEVTSLKEKINSFTFTLQLPQRAIEGNTHNEIFHRLQDYEAVANYTLLDLSGGKGIPFDIVRSKELLALIEEALPKTQLGIAGALNGENVHHKLSSLQRSKLTCDAQSGVMTNYTLDMKKTSLYIKEWNKV